MNRIAMSMHCYLKDKPEEACGVFGVYSNEPDFDAASLTYLGLVCLATSGPGERRNGCFRWPTYVNS